MSALGFSSVVHMLTSTPVCEVERPTGMGDWLVFRSGGPRPKGEGGSAIFVARGQEKVKVWMGG